MVRVELFQPEATFRDKIELDLTVHVKRRHGKYGDVAF